MRRVLVLAYYFPPLGGIGSLRVAKFAECLPEFGWEPTVIAPWDGAYFRDPTIKFDEARVVRTGVLELSRWGKRVSGSGGSDTRAASVGMLRRFVRDLVHTWMYHPDPQVGWYPFAVSAGRRALKENRFDAIFSSSFPITAHLVGRRLSAESGLPWVAEFRDPWIERLAASAPRRRAAERLERQLLTAASAIVAPSEEWRSLYVEKGARRAVTITNGFDPGDMPQSGVPASFVVTHVGSQYPERQDLSLVWQALATLRRSGEVARPRIRFVGDLHPAIRADLAAVGLGDDLECTGFVPHARALELMSDSSLLLLGGPPFADRTEEGCIAGKVFEYLATGRPVMYVGDPAMEVARLVARYPGCHVVRPNQLDLACAAIREAETPRLFQRNLEQFTRRRLTEQLACLLAEVTA